MTAVTRTMSKELLRLAQELDLYGLPAPTGSLVQLRKPISIAERIKNLILLGLRKQEPYHDRVWVGVIDSQPHPTNVLIPASGGWTAPAEFARVVNVPCPCPMMLVRQEGQHKTAIKWQAPEKFKHLPVAEQTAMVLGANVNVVDIAWYSEQELHLRVNMDWAIQLVPANDHSSFVLMRTGTTGRGRKEVGYGVFQKICDQLSDALPLITERPAIYPPLRLLAPTELARIKRLSERRRAVAAQQADAPASA